MALAGGLQARAIQPVSTQVSCGNSRQTALYRLDDSVGGWTLTTGSGTGDWIKPDFSGSLVEAVQLEVTSPTPQIDEGESVQLASRVQADDGSFLAGGITSTWMVLGGPLSSSSDGWVTAQPVYQSSNAFVEAYGGGLSGQAVLLVRNSQLDNFGRYGADGVDDTWQVRYFGLDNPDGAPGADPDHDQQDNYHEFTAGTRPDLESEVFALDINRAADLVEIGFGPMVTGRIYRVERDTDLTATEWEGVTNLVPSTPGSFVYLSDPSSIEHVRFYRVRIDYPWRATP